MIAGGNTPAMIPAQKNSAVKTLVVDAVHLALPHLVLPVTASERFTNGGIAETLDSAKQTNSDQRISYRAASNNFQ